MSDELLTILFTDVEGSTALHAEKGDAEARRILGACDELVRRQVRDHGGREIKSTGDGFMIAFTSPRKAVACALAIQHATRGQAVRVRAGLHAGEVSEEAGDLFGGAVNAAARICAKAQGGGVLVSDVVRQLCGTLGDVAFEERGLLKLRGFPERWRLYQVVPQVRGTPVGERTPFVGREMERAELRRLMERAAAGEGGLVLIGGEPGVGKTRVTQEIASEARRRFQVFVGHCYEAQGNLPYMPWVEMLETAVRDTAPETLRRDMGDEAPELARLLPELRRVVPDIPPPLELPPDQQRRYTFNCLREYVARMSRVRPRLYILEDLHWADESTLLLLEHLAERLPTIACLVVATYRDPPIDVSPQLAGTLSALVHRRQARLLSLKRHSEPEVDGLLRALSGQPPPDSIRAAIYGETEGNAFFVEEVFRHLAESGRLLDERGCFRGDLAVGELDVPANVRLVTGQRLQRLSETTQRTLSIAAVAGRRLGFELLEAIAEVNGDELIDALDEAERARLIITETEGVHEEYWFAHELIRQTLLTRLPAARRRRHHLRVADALERVFSDDLQAQAATIAQHLIEAGASADRGRLFRYLVLAGRRALESAAFEQALQQLEKAVALAEAIDPRERSELLFQFGMAQRAVGHWEEAIAAWRRCLDGYEALGDRGAVGHVCVEAGYSLVWATRWAEALEMFHRGLTALGEDRSAVRARLLARASVPLSYAGEITMGDAMLEEALGLAVNLGDDALQAFVLSEMCAARQASMRVADVVSAGQRGASALRAAGDLWPAATALGVVAINLVQLGHFDESARVAAEVAPLAERIGNLPALYLRGRAEGMRNFFARADLDALEAFGRWDLDFSERNFMGSWNGHSYTWLGLAEFLRGNWETALGLFEQGAGIAPPGALGGFCWAPLFHCQVYLGHRPEALALFEEKRPELPRSGRPNMWGWWAQLMAFTEGLYVLGQREEAAGFHPVLVEARSTGAITTSYIEGRLLERIAGISAVAGEQWDVAEEHFRLALRQADDLPHQLERLETRRFYAQMLAERDGPGDRERARQLLEEATLGYARLGMPRHEAMARELLTRAGAAP